MPNICGYFESINFNKCKTVIIVSTVDANDVAFISVKFAHFNSFFKQFHWKLYMHFVNSNYQPMKKKRNVLHTNMSFHLSFICTRTHGKFHSQWRFDIIIEFAFYEQARNDNVKSSLLASWISIFFHSRQFIFYQQFKYEIFV